MANSSAVLALLADPTRLALVEMLRGGALSVGEMVARGAVSQSAVSQHLRAMKAAELVEERRDGTRRYYSLHPRALGELRVYVEGLWSDALNGFSGDAP